MVLWKEREMNGMAVSFSISVFKFLKNRKKQSHRRRRETKTEQCLCFVSATDVIIIIHGGIGFSEFLKSPPLKNTKKKTKNLVSEKKNIALQERNLMDFSESTRIVYNRIRTLEPDNATKIIGYLFLNDHGEHEMIRLAFSPDSAIHSLIAKARADLGLSHSPIKPEQGHTYGDFTSSPKARPDPSAKLCHYFFIKGLCKHGHKCRFSHGPKTIPQQFNHVEKLEVELTELLKSRGGSPVSIATLPMLYYDKYGRTIQAEGYLTERQRHGKAGFSLSKLLSRLNNSIHLIDRPHGQHSVILAKDAHKYLDHNRSDSGGIVSGSRQIYLTFPADSGFTELDVSNYFIKFGLVQDVRIPGQHKRMFGFVTFVFPETAKQVLAKGNPHYICRARVLVKPYKDKSKKITLKIQNNGYHNPRALEPDYEIQTMARFRDIARLLDTDHDEEHDFGHVGEAKGAPKSISYHQSYFAYSNHSKLLKVPEERSNYYFDAFNGGSNNCSDQDSQGINLPESPFASMII